VWEVLEPIERHVDWMADAASIVFDGPERRGVGTRFWCVTEVGPLRLIDHMEITAWEPGRAMGVRHAGIVGGDGRFTLEPLDDGRATRFAWTERLRFPWYFGGPLGAALARPVLRWIWQRNLATLAGVVAR
jgi:hypothetical protein